MVEDVRLNYTILRTLSDQRIVIPNEKLAAGVLRNDTLRRRVGLDVAIWLPPQADVERAIAALRDETGQDADGRRGRAVGRAAGGRRRPRAAAGEGRPRGRAAAPLPETAACRKDSFR